jgi:hypothetical protein
MLLIKWNGKLNGNQSQRQRLITDRYINQNNFLRSIRNFKIDITRTNADASVCGIHWQVAQGTSLENIEFYMTKGTTHQVSLNQRTFWGSD